MNRRGFLGTLFGGTIAGLLAPQLLKAKPKTIAVPATDVVLLPAHWWNRGVVAFEAEGPLVIGEHVAVTSARCVKRAKEGDRVYGVCIETPGPDNRAYILVS